jgi:hypothetical protein
MKSITLPAFRITFTDGISYVTSMAIGVTLEMAKAYFVGARLSQWDESIKTVESVEIA